MKAAIIFPGQGAQSVGMGRSLCQAFPAARKTFEEADEILGFSLSKLCFEGPEEELLRTNNAQPAIFVTSVAAVRGLEEAGRLRRDDLSASAGLSLGEYTALWFAGSFSFEDGLRLVRLRGEAMQDASERAPSGMVSLIGADRTRAEAVAEVARGEGVLVVANLNAPGQVVLSGDLDACSRAVEAARAAGIRRAIPLKVAGAFHSPLMESARSRLEEALKSIPLRDASHPVYVNVLAEGVQEADRLRELLARQVTSPVLWEQSMRNMIASGIDTFLEPEPGKVLAGLLRKIDSGVRTTALDASWEGLSDMEQES